MNNENCNHKWVLVSDIFNEVVQDDIEGIIEVSYGTYKCTKCKKTVNIQIEPNYDESLNEYLLKKCNNDQIITDMVYDFLISKCKLGENNSKIVIDELYKNKPIFEELIKFITIDSFDFDNPLELRGYTAKSIRIDNPNMSDLEVFEALNYLYTSINNN